MVILKGSMDWHVGANGPAFQRGSVMEKNVVVLAVPSPKVRARVPWSCREREEVRLGARGKGARWLLTVSETASTF